MYTDYYGGFGHRDHLPPSMRSPNGSHRKSIVGPPKQGFIPPIVGTVLSVPTGTCAVLRFYDGRRRILTEGSHTISRRYWGTYVAQYVDARLQRTAVPKTEALCKDGWRGSVALEILWRVGNAACIVDVADPIGNLVTAAQTALRAVIETMPHDALFGNVSNGAWDPEWVAVAITDRMEANPGLEGFQIRRTMITHRQGDERRIAIMRDMAVDRKRFVEQMQVEDARRTYELLKTETERLLRTRNAEIEAAVYRTLLPIMMRQAQLDLLPKINRQRHEQALQIIEAYVRGKAAEMAQLATLGSSRRRTSVGTDGQDRTWYEELRDLVQQFQTPTVSYGTAETASPEEERGPWSEIEKILEQAGFGDLTNRGPKDGKDDNDAKSGVPTS